MERRIVLEHSDGTLAGMCRIIGRAVDVDIVTTPENIPSIINLTVGGRRTACHLVRYTDMFILYKEHTIQ